MPQYNTILLKLNDLFLFSFSIFLLSLACLFFCTKFSIILFNSDNYVGIFIGTVFKFMTKSRRFCIFMIVILAKNTLKEICFKASSNTSLIFLIKCIPRCFISFVTMVVFVC